MKCKVRLVIKSDLFSWRHINVSGSPPFYANWIQNWTSRDVVAIGLNAGDQVIAMNSRTGESTDINPLPAWTDAGEVYGTTKASYNRESKTLYLWGPGATHVWCIPNIEDTGTWYRSQVAELENLLNVAYSSELERWTAVGYNDTDGTWEFYDGASPAELSLVDNPARTTSSSAIVFDSQPAFFKADGSGFYANTQEKLYTSGNGLWAPITDTNDAFNQFISQRGGFKALAPTPTRFCACTKGDGTMAELPIWQAGTALKSAAVGNTDWQNSPITGENLPTDGARINAYTPGNAVYSPMANFWFWGLSGIGTEQMLVGSQDQGSTFIQIGTDFIPGDRTGPIMYQVSADEKEFAFCNGYILAIGTYLA